MEEYITPYGIDFKEFRGVLNTHTAMVAGSVALAGFLKQNGVDPGFEPNDIDIFIYSPPTPQTDMFGNTIKGKYRYELLELITDLMGGWGFTPNEKFSTNKNTMYTISLDRITKIVSFTNKAEKEIQVIVLSNPCIIEYMETNFDLSCCVSWWNPKSDRFETFDPYYTLKKEVYIMRHPKTDKRHQKDLERVQKYIHRGFTHIDPPCPYVYEPDNRKLTISSKFDNMKAFDIFTLEDVSVREFLSESCWNIILKSGDNYYAFHRKQLEEYMIKTCKYIDSNMETIFDTPFNQSINIKAYCSIIYSDYTIYELKNANMTVTFNDITKSLFSLHCYNIEQWINGTPGKIVSPIRKRKESRIEATEEDIIAAFIYLQQPDALNIFYADIQG